MGFLEAQLIDKFHKTDTDIVHGVIAVGFEKPCTRPIACIKLWCFCGNKAWRHLFGCEFQTFFLSDRIIIFIEIPCHANFGRHILTDTDKAHAVIAKRDAVMGIPAAEETVAHTFGHAAKGRAIIEPAWMTKADPGLAITLRHELHFHTANGVREIVVFCCGDRVGLAGQPQLVKA